MTEYPDNAAGKALEEIENVIINDVGQPLSVFYELFAEENEELLTDMAPQAFEVLFTNLLDTFVLSIGRLTDPPSHGKFHNLSLWHLVKTLDESGYTGEAQFLRDTLHNNDGRIKTVGNMRNKVIAHRDAAVARGEVRLAGADREEIVGLLETLLDAVNYVAVQLTGVTKHYRVHMQSGGDAIIACLEHAQQWRRAWKQAANERDPDKLLGDILNNRV
jgi:hypothetical protein